MLRSAGILMPVSSLPEKYGIGTFGKEAYHFVDFLKEAGQTYWQVLPFGPTGFGNSPYQSFSSYALNPYFLDLAMCIEEGLLKEEEVDAYDWGEDEERVDYGALYASRFEVLKIACTRLALVHPEDYLTFLKEEGFWVKDYALFMALKQINEGKPWTAWDKEYRNHHSEEVRQVSLENQELISFYTRLQYLLYRQARALKAYANRNHIQIIGDLPFYVAQDSIDVWANPEQFDVDENFEMTYVAGMAPDWGNPEGQKWGNPLFNWEYQRNHGYDWWLKRAEHMMQYCDVLRIDHFKGYETYFAIPAEGKAEQGEWREGPGLALFDRLKERLPQTDIIVEDLGILTPSFLKFVEDSKLPGMKILEYAFDPNDPASIYMPWQYPKNSVVYTGTHDNNTVAGWLSDPNEKARVENARMYLGLNKEEGEVNGVVRAAYASASDLALIPLQDILGLGKECRMNDPAGQDNWVWRVQKDMLGKADAKKLNKQMHCFCRYNWSIDQD